MDVHHEVTDGASGAELDLGMAPAHTREAIDAVDDDLFSATSYALDGDRVATESHDETIPLFRLGRAAGYSHHCAEQEREKLKRTQL
jgi:hypothetical protein